GNITAGIDLCRRKLGETVFGLTLPLLTNADGSKFGKSIDGAVWLDTDKTCVYKFYQFWIRTDDRDVVRFLKLFTFLNKEEIDLLAEEHLAKPEARKAHQALAHEMTALIHGETAAREAAGASRILFGGTLEGISETMFREITGEVPSTPIPASEWNVDGIPLIELLIKTGLCKSKGQARKDIQGGGIYINNERISDPQLNVGDSSLLFGKYTLLRKGKKYYNLLILE
ncbi:MAG: tyrosine--tRNA ligase, partial [Verrucomicrobia bacterium]|nr:tyrosine--tRNA ligase [Verrucomicrobiota bacterium]